MSIIQTFNKWRKDQIGYVILGGFFGYQYGYTDVRFYTFVIAYIISLIICWGYGVYLTMNVDFDFNKEYRSKVWIQAISLIISYMGMSKLLF